MDGARCEVTLPKMVAATLADIDQPMRQIRASGVKPMTLPLRETYDEDRDASRWRPGARSRTGYLDDG
jgi:hypothetical protein